MLPSEKGLLQAVAYCLPMQDLHWKRVQEFILGVGEAGKYVAIPPLIPPTGSNSDLDQVQHILQRLKAASSSSSGTRSGRCS